jgi:WD40 repeat protein
MVRGQEPPNFGKHVGPFLARYCIECHNADDAKGSLDVTSVEGLKEGGSGGPAIVAGKPDESPLVLRVEGKKKPVMPPAGSPQPPAEEIALLRAWVADGARGSGKVVALTLPAVAPRKRPADPITAVAYRPDGQWLAASGHKEVRIIDVKKGEVIDHLVGQGASVTALAFDREGRRLAVASGSSGAVGAVRIYTLTDGKLGPKPSVLVRGHTDLIYDLVFSPDGALLATCGYDRLIKLWNTEEGKEVRTLKDHSDTVYSLAFNPDGKLLASGAADRAVKIWDVASGKRLYTLGDSTDWVYAVAWSRDGKQVAASGVDRSIRVWDVNADGGKLTHAAFAHTGPVLRLAYSADGQMLYSLSEDRTIKSWDAQRLTAVKAYPAQAESVLSLAVRPDRKQLAVGRFDGALVLLDEATGEQQGQPLPVKPKPPVLNRIEPANGQRGQLVRVTFHGKDLSDVTEVVASTPGIEVKIVAADVTAETVKADLSIPAQFAPGETKLSLKSAAGTSAVMPFVVDRFALKEKQGKNDTAAAAQPIALPVTIAGMLERAGAVDFYRFDVKAGQQVGAQASVIGKPWEPVVRLTAGDGKLVAEGDGALGYTAPQDGTFVLSVHDREYRGGMAYRLHVGEVAVVTALFPLGIQRGTDVEVQLQGVHLGTDRVRIKVPADAAVGSKVPLPLTPPHGAALGLNTIVVGEFPEMSGEAELPVPGTANGRIGQPGKAEVWRFHATKGHRLIVEVNARRLGSPLDSTIEILDAKDQPVARAVLRCVAKTYTTLRDHDSATPGIRLESWNELAVNDYLYGGNQLLRIRAMPRGPDDDTQFFSDANQRTGFLDTTPTFISQGAPLYKVSLHPPGTTFPPNGLPLVHLPYRNDDGGPGYGKDSRITFDAPADGEYRVRVADARGQGGNAYAYRLTVRPPRPSFEVRWSPTSPMVRKGDGLPINVTAERIDGFEGPIELRLVNVPPGLHAPEATAVPASENSTSFALWADANAVVAADAAPLKLVARAKIDGHEMVREVPGGVVKVAEAEDLLTTTEQREVVVKPGQTVKVTARVDRRNDFKGRVPLDVRGLPHGVRVLDVGLNGILITEQQSERTFEIYCEPWVLPTDHPFVVFARREGKNTEHAAPSVLLRVVKE